jgi:hypothetical protein
MPDPADTAFSGRVERARAEVRGMKERHMATLLIAQSAKERGVEVFADRLRGLQVSTLPMVAYRFLGFGGRMFEVPFVEVQLDWLGVDPPSGRILP